LALHREEAGIQVERTLKEILWLQLGASLDMLGNAVSACPKELWERPSDQMGFWYMAYHALWFLDHDLSPAGGEFAPPAFDIHNYELAIKEPPYLHSYSKSDVQEYLQHCRLRAQGAIERLDDPNPRVLRGCERAKANATEVIVGQIRHIQHHSAQLNLLLRQATDSAPGWVRRTKDA
jgi:hypothetical protein